MECTFCLKLPYQKFIVLFFKDVTFIATKLLCTSATFCKSDIECFSFPADGRKDLSISIKIKNAHVLQPSNSTPGNLSQRNKHMSRLRRIKMFIVA